MIRLVLLIKIHQTRYLSKLWGKKTAKPQLHGDDCYILFFHFKNNKQPGWNYRIPAVIRQNRKKKNKCGFVFPLRIKETRFSTVNKHE